jgi:spore germination cell wall hydrolase CwlJ-like protein
MAEAGGEPYAGQMAVAQVILNTCKLEHKRPPEVIADHGYSQKRPAPTQSVMDAVDDVFCNGRKVLDERVTMFYAPEQAKNHYSDDHETQIYADTIGGHRFFIERQYT